MYDTFYKLTTMIILFVFLCVCGGGGLEGVGFMTMMRMRMIGGERA